MTIGSRINSLRQEKGFTQEQIAAKLNVTRQAVSKWEQDQTCPDTWNLIELAKLFETTVEFIALGNDAVRFLKQTDTIQTETFCGRSCKTCRQKELLHCSGCKHQTTQTQLNQCDISNCCTSRNLNTCSLCKFVGTCKKLTLKDMTPEKRLVSQKVDAQRRELQMEVAEDCGRITNILPFAAIAYLLGTLLLKLVPFIMLPVGIAYAVCLFVLSPHSDSYKTAGYLSLSACILQTIAQYIPAENALPSLVIGTIYVVANLFRLRCEYEGHQTLSVYFDYNLSDSYAQLWKWYLILPAVELVALLFVGNPLLLFPAIVALIGSAIGQLVVHVFHIRNLFRLRKSMKLE